MRNLEWIKICLGPIVVIVGSLLIAYGCHHLVNKWTEHICNEMVISSEPSKEALKTKISVTTLTYNNHQYLVFQQNNIIDDNQLEIIHDPDCPCYTKETNP